jgi:glycosyltransferase involved in cell wall biosynthesis
MRIAFLVDRCAPLFPGGYEDRYWNLAKQLAKNHEVRVYSSMDQDELFLSGVRFVRANLPRQPRGNLESRNHLHSLAYSLQLVRNPFGKWGPEIVIVEAIPYLHLLTSPRWLRRLHAKVILNVNEAWSDYAYLSGPFSRPSRAIIRYLMRRGLSVSNLVIAISSATADSLRENFGYERAVIVPMGINPTEFRRAEVPARFGSRPYDFISVGRLVPIKRQADFLKALAVLKANTGWKGRAALIGEGPCKSRLEVEASKLGLSENVSFIGRADEATKYRLLRESKVFVLCSEREGFSLATLEAMISGAAPVVARPEHQEVFGVRDLVQDGFNGLIYPVGDIPALVSCLTRLQKDEESCQRLACASRSKASGFTWDDIATSFEKGLMPLR